jgi:ferritin
MSEIKMNPDLLALFNREVQLETASSQIYRAMATVATQFGYPGFASCLLKQAKEEQTHSAKFSAFIELHGDQVGYDPIEGYEPPQDLLSMFVAIVEREKLIKDAINEIIDKAIEVKDYGCLKMLNYFANNQIKEINFADQVRKQIELCKGDQAGLLHIDHQLAKKGK